MNTKEYRSICGKFGTGITVITTKIENNSYGFTANSFTSVSLDPQIILFCLNIKSDSNAAFQKSKSCAINILSSSQEEISNIFASSKNSQDERFNHVSLIKNEMPVLKGSLAYLIVKIIKFEEIGDHMVYYCQVTDGKRFEGNPLIYAEGKYQQLL
jgi:flavin reductase (DIM6/NTAB) family NADH-FMN oxidoreductase RutF